MKRNALVFIAILLTVSGFAQKTADIGIWGGGSLYWGDMTKVDYSKSINPMFGAFFRYNFNPRVALRVQYLRGKIGAEGSIENEPWIFGPKNLQDVSVMVEINYLKYILGYKKTPVSPYIMAGFGVKYFPYNLDPAAIFRFNQTNNKGVIEINKSVVAASIPFGMGIKTHIGERFGVGAEFIVSKLFSDKIDNLDDPMAHTNPLGDLVTYTNFLHNNDYTAYVGIYLTYKIYLGKQICPVYESKNQ